MSSQIHEDGRVFYAQMTSYTLRYDVIQFSIWIRRGLTALLMYYLNFSFFYVFLAWSCMETKKIKLELVMKQKNKKYFVLVLWDVNVSFNLSGKRKQRWKIQAGDNGFL